LRLIGDGCCCSTRPFLCHFSLIDQQVSLIKIPDFSSLGMRDTLALPLSTYFSPSGHARTSCVTAPLFFSPERACETLSRYRSPIIFPRAGTRDLLALPLPHYFSPSGHARPSCVTAPLLFSSKRARNTLSSYLNPLPTQTHHTLPPQPHKKEHPKARTCPRRMLSYTLN
jgi:hypothetical protein